MITVCPGYDLLLARFSQTVEIVMDDADGRVVRHGATSTEKDVIQALGRQFCELGRQFGRRRRREMAERRKIRNLPYLIGNRLRHFLVGVTDIDAPQAPDAVNVAVTVRIDHIGSLGIGHHHRSLFLECREISPRMDKVIPILAPKALGIVFQVCGHPNIPQSSVEPNSRFIAPCESFCCINHDSVRPRICCTSPTERTGPIHTGPAVPIDVTHQTQGDTLRWNSNPADIKISATQPSIIDLQFSFSIKRRPQSIADSSTSSSQFSTRIKVS